MPPTAGCILREFPSDLSPESEAVSVKMGTLPCVIASASDRTHGCKPVTRVDVFQYDMTLKNLAMRLTFGALEGLLPKFLDSSYPFWDPFIIRNFCFEGSAIQTPVSSLGISLSCASCGLG